MPILENLRKALGFDREITDERAMDLPWEEDFAPLGHGSKVPDATSLNMPRLVDALRRLYASLDDETRRAVSDGDLPELKTKPDVNVASAVSTLGNQDFETLKQAYDDLKIQKLALDNKLRAMQNRVAELERNIADAVEKDKREIASIAQVAHAEAVTEMKRLQTLNDQLNTKSKMSDRMLSDMQKSLVEQRRANEALAQENAAIKQQMQHNDSGVSLDELRQKLADAEKLIGELQKANSNLKQQSKELRETIESNLYNQAHTENQLRRRIKQLEGVRSRKKGRKKAEKPEDDTNKTIARDKSSLDKALNATDWIDGIPDSSVGEDFGYKEPPQKQTPDPDEQLFLF